MTEQKKPKSVLWTERLLEAPLDWLEVPDINNPRQTLDAINNKDNVYGCKKVKSSVGYILKEGVGTWEKNPALFLVQMFKNHTMNFWSEMKKRGFDVDKTEIFSPEHFKACADFARYTVFSSLSNEKGISRKDRKAFNRFYRDIIAGDAQNLNFIADIIIQLNKDLAEINVEEKYIDLGAAIIEEYQFRCFSANMTYNMGKKLSQAVERFIELNDIGSPKVILDIEIDNIRRYALCLEKVCDIDSDELYKSDETKSERLADIEVIEFINPSLAFIAEKLLTITRQYKNENNIERGK